MKQNRVIFLIFILLMLLTTGCWDRKELNDRAIIIAWGFDLNKDGTYRGTTQFALPSKMGSGKSASQGNKAFVTVSGTGKNLYEAARDMQLKVSRTWFSGHRRVILIGEELARHGLATILDQLSRDPIVRLRADMFVLKGGSVQDFLELPYPLERLSANALVKMHEAAGLNPDLTLRNFLMAASSEESCPILPAVEKTDSPSKEGSEQTAPEMKLRGFAIFDKENRLVTYLPMKESFIRQWIVGKLNSNVFTVNIPGEKGNILVELDHLKRNIKTSQRGNKVSITVTLGGKGTIRENNTRLDLSESKNVILVQQELNRQTGKFVQKVIQEAQALGTDIFGFGEAFHRQHPYAWKGIKKEWANKFADAEVIASLHLQVWEEGKLGPSGILKENEMKR
ncbi:Ger(x)C family spore germination protein [Paenibacillus sp. B1-33]|uniref:Ger(x)C family spore germination protein n=1 Tax=unclassified Paenibacillus TaxID=185978 RepID=UPI003D27338D